MSLAPRLPRFAQRKNPRQRRSQIVVETIISTAAELFEDDGYAYVSTNMIAASANLSIGSIYQYFANRESIALAVHELACANAALQMKHRAVDHLGLPLAQAIHDHMATLFDIYQHNHYALVGILAEVPELRQAALPISFDRLIHQTLAMFLRQHFPAADGAEVARKCYFVERTTISAISRYLEECPDDIMSREQAIDEVADLALCYVMTLSRDGGDAVAL